MRRMPPRPERRNKSLFIVLTVASASLVLSVACGGGKPDAKAPGSEGTATTSGSSGAATSGSSSGDVSSGGASGGNTTTTSLPDGGELQGAKLGSSTHTEVETKGDGGPKAGPGHTQEPGRSRQDIQTIIMARRDEARACYDKGLKDHPGIEGDLTVKWTIDPAGKVTDAAVDTSKSTINEPGVGACIVEIIKKVSFAPSKGGFETRANYPFNFHPKTFGKPDAGH
jgi:TonB family protein